MGIPVAAINRDADYCHGAAHVNRNLSLFLPQYRLPCQWGGFTECKTGMRRNQRRMAVCREVTAERVAAVFIRSACDAAHFLDAVRNENGQVHLQRHFAGHLYIVSGVERGYLRLPGPLRGPSQASQLLHRSHRQQGICSSTALGGSWVVCDANKKGPPFGEPFLILRMVPAPGVESISKYLI